MTNDPAHFATPDPIVSTEAIGAIVIGLITNAIILFNLNLSEARQAALIAIVNAAIAAAVLVHGAVVRKGRALGNSSK